jgi:hypothetical protein
MEVGMSSYRLVMNKHYFNHCEMFFSYSQNSEKRKMLHSFFFKTVYPFHRNKNFAELGRLVCSAISETY